MSRGTLNKLDRDCKREQRIIWLILNYSLWSHLPEPSPNPEFREWYNWRTKYSKPIVQAMHEAGVLSRATAWDCINTPAHIVDALAILKKERAEL